MTDDDHKEQQRQLEAILRQELVVTPDTQRRWIMTELEAADPRDLHDTLPPKTQTTHEEPTSRQAHPPQDPPAREKPTESPPPVVIGPAPPGPGRDDPTWVTQRVQRKRQQRRARVAGLAVLAGVVVTAALVLWGATRGGDVADTHASPARAVATGTALSIRDTGVRPKPVRERGAEGRSSGDAGVHLRGTSSPSSEATKQPPLTATPSAAPRPPAHPTPKGEPPPLPLQRQFGTAAAPTQRSTPVPLEHRESSPAPGPSLPTPPKPATSNDEYPVWFDPAP